MSAEPYTPTEDELANCYVLWGLDHRDDPDTLRFDDEARRGIAKIKADALREAATGVFDTALPAACARYLEARADQIEKEARND